jgi:hypothetical protein
VSDELVLQRPADQYAAKDGWPFTVRAGALFSVRGRALVFAATPATVFGFGMGEVFSQTR